MSGEWPLHIDPAVPFGERVAQCAVQALADGKLSKSARLDFYRAFTACGGTEVLIPISGTTCAVFAGAVLHWAGRPATLPRYHSPTSITSWLNGLSGNSPAWKRYGDPACIPVPGSIFYVEADSNPLNNHVGVLISELDADVWLTAEGGKGDGSECSVGLRVWGLGWDARRLRGLWLPQFMSGVGAPPATQGLALPDFPIVKGDSRRDVVTRWQKRLLARFPGCLPQYGADGGYGAETVTATLKAATSFGIASDGCSVTLQLWEACG